MANPIIGSQIIWGTSSTSGTLTGLGSLSLLQSRELSGDAKEDLIADQDGNTRTAVYYDQMLKASLEFVITNGNTAGGVSVTAYPSAGVTLALTDAQFTPIAGTWIVQKPPSFPASNTKALMCKIDLVKFINNGFPA